MFSLQNVTKEYVGQEGSPVRALDSVTMEALSNRITCVVGPTGSGKTTILRVLAGLESPDSGAVLRHGGPASGQGERIGYLSQRHTLFPWMRIKENIAIPLEVNRLSPSERVRRVSAICGLLGLSEAENRYPYEISGGMQQRAALGRLLASEASCWLMDEPFNALDERTRHRMQELLIGLVRDRGLSILFVTHSIDEAVFLADRIIVLSAGPGRVVESFDISMPHKRDRLSLEYGQVIERVRRRIESILQEGIGQEQFLSGNVSSDSI